MKKQNARWGVVGSLALHSALFAAVWWAIQQPSKSIPTEELTSISMEMMAAVLEQPQVAVEAEVPPEPETEVEPEPISEPEPIPEPPKPQEKPKEIPKEKPKPKKTKPKIEKKRPLEKGPEAKEGVVAKMIPDAVQGTKLQTEIAGNAAQTKLASGTELNAYKVRLQRALQQKANNAYPQREKMMRKMGIVTLSFQLSPTGKIINVSVVKSSGNSNLDTAAIKAAQSTEMKSPPPAGFPHSLTVPVRFRVE